MGQMLVEPPWAPGLHAHIALRFSGLVSGLAYLQGLLGSVEPRMVAVGRIWGRYARWGAAAGGVPLGRGPGSGRPARVVMEHLGDPGGVLVARRGFSSKANALGGGKATVQRHGGEGGELSDRGIPGLWQPSVSAAFLAALRRGGLGRSRKPMCRKGWRVPKHPGPRDDRPRGGGWRALCLGNWGYGVRQ